MTILVSTLIQSKAKVGENFYIIPGLKIHQQYNTLNAGEKLGMLVLVYVTRLLLDYGVC